MKKWPKKIWISVAAVLIAIMSMSAIPASADTSRVIWFTIQNNNACSASGYYSTLYLNMNNISSTTAEVTVKLYNGAGTAISTPGNAGGASGYFGSTFQPGDPFTIGGKQTKHYFVAFGDYPDGGNCSDRPAYGNIVVNNAGLLMANGEIKGTSSGVSPSRVLTDTTIFINNGQPF